MARPRKPDDQRLKLVTTSLSRRELDAIERFAETRGVKVARVVRALIRQGFRNLKTVEPESSLTL